MYGIIYIIQYSNQNKIYPIWAQYEQYKHVTMQRTQPRKMILTGGYLLFYPVKLNKLCQYNNYCGVLMEQHWSPSLDTILRQFHPPQPISIRLDQLHCLLPAPRSSKCPFKGNVLSIVFWVVVPCSIYAVCQRFRLTGPLPLMIRNTYLKLRKVLIGRNKRGKQRQRITREAADVKFIALSWIYKGEVKIENLMQ